MIELSEFKYDAIVVGAGHAGCEAALALSRKGHKVLLFSVSLDNIAYMACNPSIGGTAKGHLVREVDALGGEMGVNTDKTLLQIKMLNSGKGAAVQSLRAQSDKSRYHVEMKKTLERQANLDLKQAEVVRILIEECDEKRRVCGVETAYGERYSAGTVVLACGVYLKSDVIIGESRKSSGPSGFLPADALTANLRELGFEIRRFKTGTPARVLKSSLDFSRMTVQEGEEGVTPFSFLDDRHAGNRQPCYLTYTTAETKRIILENLHRAPMYSGAIKGTGPRYCPSIEDKIVRFPDKEQHQIFIEPEGEDTDEMYVQGMSTSMPVDVQQAMYRSVIGLERVKILRYAYAIEYDCIDPTQLTPALMYKNVDGLFTAGQINGSSGYEEAAAQGLMAGLNAALYLEGREPLVLSRSEAYIGVLIDDLVTKGTNEPYRMMTSRAEYRLHLRQDNADLRLTEKGYAAGLVTEERLARFRKKQERIRELLGKLERVVSPKEYGPLFERLGEAIGGGLKLSEMLRRPNVHMEDLTEAFGLGGYSRDVYDFVETEIRYEGYLKRQNEFIERLARAERVRLPEDIRYADIHGLRLEARQKLDRIRPQTLAQAANISGVSPADISVLMLYLKMRNK